MAKNILSGPWGNPRLKEGHYAAQVVDVSHHHYGEDDGELLELVLRLDDSGQELITRQYLPKEFSAGCKHRFWYLCQALGIEGWDLVENPIAAVRRRIVLEIVTVHPTMANHGRAYSDVERFLPFTQRNRESTCSTKDIGL